MKSVWSRKDWNRESAEWIKNGLGMQRGEAEDALMCDFLVVR